MKISNQNQNYSIYQKKPKNPVFKGYFAAPIKELHVQPSCQAHGSIHFVRELEKKCSKYFDIIFQLGKTVVRRSEDMVLDDLNYIKGANYSRWGQDNKLFLENGDMAVLEDCDLFSHAKELARATKLNIQKVGNKIEGGNCFLGKKQNGENFALVGINTINASSKELVSQSLNVKPENLHVISQPDFHIDMGIRPLNYPYVLVGDDKLTKKLIPNKMITNAIEKLNEGRNKYIAEEKYSDADKIIKELKEQGFVPIRVPGLMGKNEANFMNAVVHQNENGEMIYITNSMDKSLKKYDINLEANFEKFIKKKVPLIKEVIFIDGKDFVTDSLSKGGGVHCMTSERPDFELWNRMLNK